MRIIFGDAPSLKPWLTTFENTGYRHLVNERDCADRCVPTQIEITSQVRQQESKESFIVTEQHFEVLKCDLVSILQ